jgi:hypothetical protein
MYTNAKITQTWSKSYIFLDETGCILNEKMMPDINITVPELEIDKKHIGRNFPTLHPQPLQFLSVVYETFGASPYMEFSSETSLLQLDVTRAATMHW